MADGVSIFLCRNRRDTARCVDGTCTRPGLMKCAFPLRGRRAGQTCGAAVCADHVQAGAGGIVCPAHARLLAREAGR